MQTDFGLAPNVDTYHTLIGVCGRCGDAASAFRIFGRRFALPAAVADAAALGAPPPDAAATAVGPATPVTYAVLLGAALECRSPPHVLEVLRLMRAAGVALDEGEGRAAAALGRSAGDVDLLLALAEPPSGGGGGGSGGGGGGGGGGSGAAAGAAAAGAAALPRTPRVDARATRELVLARAPTWSVAQLSDAVASVGTVDAGVVVALFDAAVAARDVAVATALLGRAVWEHGRAPTRWPLSAYPFNVLMGLVGATAPKPPPAPKSPRGRKASKKSVDDAAAAAAAAATAAAATPGAGTPATAADGGVARTLALLALMKQTRVAPTEVTYATAVAVAARAGAVETAARLAAEMQDVGLGGVDSYAWTALLDALGKAGDWARSAELLGQMRAAGAAAAPSMAAPSVASYNAVVYAAGMAGEQGVAFAVWDAMLADGVAPDEVTYSSLASTCLKCQRDLDEARVRAVVDGLTASQTARAAVKGRRPSKKLSDKINRLHWLLRARQPPASA